MMICLIRHGETEYNRERRYQGQVEVPLNENGRKMAQETAEALALLPWDRIFTSPLERARDTAVTIADACGLPSPEILPDLIERGLGIAEGRLIAEVPEDFRQQMRDETLEGIEPKARVRERMASAVAATMEKHPDENLIFVSHGGAIRSFLSGVLNEQVKPLRNCSVNLLETEEGGLRVLLMDADWEQLRNWVK